MADNTQDQGTQGTVATSQADANGEATATPAKLYTTRADAEAAKPADASKALRPFEVLHNGTSKGFVLARGHGAAIEQVARLDGYSATTGKPPVPVTKEAVVAKLASFTDDELAAMGLQPREGQGQQEVGPPNRRGRPPRPPIACEESSMAAKYDDIRLLVDIAAEYVQPAALVEMLGRMVDATRDTANKSVHETLRRLHAEAQCRAEDKKGGGA